MNLSFLAKTALFQGTTPDEVQAMLECLGAEARRFSKGDIIYHAGDTVTAMGLVLSGAVNMEHDDMWGNKSILGHTGAAQIFAETYSCIPGERLMVSVVATEPTQVLFLNASRLLQTCPSACVHHSKLIHNLLSVTAQKNLALSRRALHTSSKSIRGRLLSYLSDEAAQQGSYEFTIPFNRQQLADYLGVDRSALSNELSKMQKDGLLSANRSHFSLTEKCGSIHF